MHSYQIL